MALKAFLPIATIIAAVAFINCNTNSGGAGKDGYVKDTLNVKPNVVTVVDTPRSFVKNYGVNDNNPIFVFVGEKIWVESIPSRPGSMDKCFKAKYIVLMKVYGEFSSDTIEFIVYDHYGTPDFAPFKNVLLYVSADKGTYVHQKYLYNDVYKTRDGRWAGPYNLADYKHENNKKTKIKPRKMDFAESVSYPITAVAPDGAILRRTFPKPYFRIVGDSAFAVYGNYIGDLFVLKRDGFLAARGVFKNGKLSKM